MRWHAPGMRVTAVTNEVSRRERVDIGSLVGRSRRSLLVEPLAPAEVMSVVVDEEKNSMDVVVDEANLAPAAIGRARMFGWHRSLQAGRST